MASLEKQACSCPGLQAGRASVSGSCRQPSQPLFIFLFPSFLHKDAKQERACRVGDLP